MAGFNSTEDDYSIRYFIEEEDYMCKDYLGLKGIGEEGEIEIVVAG